MIFDIVSVAITFVEIIAFLSLLGVFAEEKNWYKKYKISDCDNCKQVCL